LEKIESAKLGDLDNSSGTLTGNITFTVPAYATNFDSIVLTPMVFSLSPDGERCAVFDTARMRPTVLRMTGR
jgi:hypothetical protein